MTPAGRSDEGPLVAPAPHRRVTPSGLFRVLFICVTVGFATWAVISNWAGIRQAWASISIAPVLAAVALGVAGTWAAFPAWRCILRGFGSRLPIRPAQRVFFLGQLGKYVPGGIWTVVAQTALAQELGVPRTRSSGAGLVSILVGFVTAALVSVSLVFTDIGVLGAYSWALILVLPIGACLHPRVLHWLVLLTSRLTRRTISIDRIPGKDLAIAVLFQFTGQLFLGLHLWLVIAAVSGVWVSPLVAIGLFNLAVAAGTIAIFAPAGVGVREGVIAFGLAPFLGAGVVVLIVLLSRIMSLIADFLVAATSAILAGSVSVRE